MLTELSSDYFTELSLIFRHLYIMTRDVGNLADQCQKLVDDTVDGRSSIGDFTEKLRIIGVTSSEAKDYVEQLEQRTRQQKNDGKRRESDARNEESIATSSSLPTQLTRSNQDNRPSSSIEGLPVEQEVDSEGRLHREDEQEVDRTGNELSEEVAWAVLQAKLGSIQPPSTKPSITVEDVVKLLGINEPSTSTGIPSAVLAAAPHLASISEDFSNDEHLQKTYNLRRAYAHDKAIEPIIDLMQSKRLIDPIPRSIWHTIIQDSYVNFEKLYASMDRSYNHQDKPKEFAGGFALVRKDHYSSKKSVKSEGDWIRLFEAWRSEVIVLYPHRTLELEGYRNMVIDLFRAAPTEPQIAIQFDADARDLYSLTPFYMDDRSRLNVPLLSQMFHASRKRDANDQISPRSRR